MAKLASGATVNGTKPIVRETTHDYGTRGGAGQSKPQASQIAGEGAGDPGTGKHITTPAPGLRAAGAPEFQTTGTTAEEQAKKLAGSMYPSSRGLRRFGAG